MTPGWVRDGAEWSHSGTCGQWVDVQVETGEECWDHEDLMELSRA